MGKIRAIIIDDDAFIRKDLANKLQAFNNELELLDVFENPIESLEPIQRQKPDLIFLDIQMPVMNGFQLLDALDTSTFEVIFITSFDKYAIQAIRYSALDYLLKPISSEDLKRSLNLFKERNEKVLTKARLSILKSNLNKGNASSFELIIPTKQGEYQFPVNDIIRCEADSNYTMIYLKGGRKFLASKTLSNVENLIESDQFLRVHKSHLINKDCIKSVNAANEIQMADNSIVAISRRRLTEIKSLLGTG